MANNDLDKKLGLFNFADKYKPTLAKFLVPLSLVSFDDIKKIVDYLVSKGIEIKKPSQLNVLLNDYNYITSMVEKWEKNGDLSALQEDALRINCKTALDRLNHLKSNNLPYKNEKGYFKIIFHINEFNQAYSNENKAPVFEPIQPIISAPSVAPIITKSHPTKTVTPIQPSDFKKDEVVEPVTQNVPAENLVKIPQNVLDVLSKPQTTSLNDDTFEIYDYLSGIVREVILSLYNQEEIEDRIIDNLIKLITNKYALEQNGISIDEKDIVLYSMVYPKVITNQAEKERLENAINDKFQYTDFDKLAKGLGIGGR